MRRAILCCLALIAIDLHAQNTASPPKPDLGVILCWNNPGESLLAHDPVLLTAVGRALSLDGVAKTVGIHSESCAQRMPDTICFGSPGGVMCQISVIERVLRASAWITAHYESVGPTSYEAVWKQDPEYVGHAFLYADGVREDPSADHIRSVVGGETEKSKPFFDALVEYNLATLLGHETTHSRDGACSITTKSLGEASGLFTKVVSDDTSGDLFAKHSPATEEVVADRCGMRNLRALNDRLQTKPAIQYPDSMDTLRRSASDMVVFQSVFGWRKFKEVPNGKYPLFSLDSYLYSPFRAILFSREIAGNSPSPLICGSSAQLIVQSIQATYKKYEGNGTVSDDLLALFPKGVEKSWNGAPWTSDSFTCQPVH